MLKIPRDLSRWTNDKLLALSSDKLTLLCKERALAKSGSKKDRVLRLLEWKRSNKPPKEKKTKKREREDESPVSSQTQLIVNVTIANNGSPGAKKTAKSPKKSQPDTLTFGKHKVDKL